MNNANKNANKNTNKTLNSNQTNAAKIVLFFFELQLATKIFHFQTFSYSNHKATDKLFEKLADLTDSFLEKYFGAFGRPTLRLNSSVPVENMTKTKFLKMVDVADAYMRGPLDKMISKNTELQNIRDEILGELDQVKYLLTLK